MSSRDKDDDEEITVRIDHHNQQETHRTSPSRQYFCYCSWFPQLLSIFLRSLKIIFLENPKRFLSIYIFTCLPLSVLLTCQALSTRALKAHINRLEWVARAAEVWVEADNVRDESKIDLRRLLRYKAMYGIPICLLSFISLNAAVSAVQKWNRPLFISLRATWARVTLTCVVGYFALITWALLSHVTEVVVGAAVVTVVFAAAEAYMTAVLSLALVVSVADERAGLEAIRAGSGMMKGRRVVGWVLSGMVFMGSAFIGREMIGTMEGEDGGMHMGGEYGREWTVRMRYGYMGGLVIMLGWAVLWSYVVFTVFYGDCCNKKRSANSNTSSTTSSFTAKELEEY